MSKQVTTKTETQLTLDNADANILSAAKAEAGFEKLLKFRKGEFSIQDDVVPVGTEFLAHAAAWTKTWIKFIDGKLVERRLYRVARGETPPLREALDDLDQASWPRGHDGKPADPWVFQYLLPLENLETGELVIFATQSVGGRRAVSDLAESYGKQALAKRKANQHSGQPIVRLGVADMPTRNFGKVLRPVFEIVGWDEMASREGPETPLEKVASASDDMDDEIPF